MTTIPQFDRTGPLYEIVETYQFFVVGIGLLYHQPREIVGKESPVSMGMTVEGDISIEPLQVKNRFDLREFDFSGINQALMRLLSNWAYERVRNAYCDDEWSRLRKDHPELEYLRHVRNASSHKEGRWHFSKDEPKQIAAWRDQNLTEELHGKSMWKTGLKTGDILILLSDVDKILVATPPSGGW